ncbi:MAG TPA: hypothetical protein VH063_04390 [Gaiellaceae bacterium]|nr:hypothetical protein [Gaiellaceae bacterium]
MFDAALELAENPNTYVPLAAGDERIVTERYVLWMGRGDEPHWNVAQRFRFEPQELDEARVEIHDALRMRGRTACTWEVGSSASPDDLVERLLELGLLEEEGSSAVGMVLEEPIPSSRPDGIEVRRSRGEGDEIVAAEIAAIAFGGSVSPRAFHPDSPVVTYLAYLDGEPVGRATASFSEYGVSLFGGAVLPAARGRGAYRALVVARHADAAARGRPLAVTQGGPMSRPILARLGFREVCEIRTLLDAFDRD